MIRFNIPGLVMAVIAGLVGLAVHGFLNGNGVYVTTALLFVFDIAYRLRSDDRGWDKWLAGRSGGFLGFSPVWITGLLLLVLYQSGWLLLD